MVQAQKRSLIGFLIFLSLFLCGGLSAKEKKGIAFRHWVVKLKQNSFMNRRPFQFASPFAEEKKVFVGIQREIFYGIDAQRGKKLWRFKAEGPIYATARVDGENVYFADMKGTVYALNKETGRPLWRTQVTGPVMSAPLIIGDKLYLVSLTKELSCLDLKEGHILWQQSFGARNAGFTMLGSSDPVLFSSLILVGYSDGDLVAHALEDGNIRWSKKLGDPFSEFHDVDSTPFIVKGLDSEEVAYVSSADGKLFALSPQNGQVVWEANVGGVNDAVFADPFLYVAAKGVVYCLVAEGGRILWEQDLQVPELSSPAIYKDWLVVVATKGKAYFIDRKTGDIVKSWYVRGGSYSDPVVEGNHVYILSNASRLYAFQFR